MVDRFAAGCFLFALFSRSRWSDLRVEGKITGYLVLQRSVVKECCGEVL